MYSQEFLQSEAERRAQWAQKCGENAPSNDFCAVAVVSRFSPTEFVESSYGFTAGIPPEIRTKWCANYTRTFYLAGDPDNISARFPPAYISTDGSVAWYGPDIIAATTNLRKLLRPLVGTSEIVNTVEVDRSDNDETLSPSAAVLAVEMNETTAERYLVHSNHIVSEALTMGLLDDTDSIKLRLVDRIDSEDGPYDYLRIAADYDRPELLRCYAALKLSPQHRVFANSITVDIGSAELRSSAVAAREWR